MSICCFYLELCLGPSQVSIMESFYENITLHRKCLTGSWIPFCYYWPRTNRRYFSSVYIVLLEHVSPPPLTINMIWSAGLILIYFVIIYFDGIIHLILTKIFRKKPTFRTPWYAHVHSGVRNIYFSENFAYALNEFCQYFPVYWSVYLLVWTFWTWYEMG